MIDAKLEKRLHVFGSACYLLAGVDNIDCEDPLKLAEGEFSRLEQKFASFRPASIVCRINEAAGTGEFIPLDAESRSLFSYVTALWDQSNHLFDPTVHVLLEGNPQEMLKLVGWAGIEIQNSGARLPIEGMAINLDSCIRPYAVDSVRKLLIKNGVSNALIDLDQDVVSIGKQPDGANWLVGLRHPKGSRTAIARLKTEQAGLRWLEKLGLPWMAVDRKLNCHGPLAPA